MQMLVRCFWRGCRYRHKEWGAEPVDAFWVEATLAEAEAAIFPRLTQEAVAESKALGERLAELARNLGRSPYCFLVARDLSSIDPHEVHYPINQMWNAYSPFAAMPRRKIRRLEELASIVLLAEGSQGQAKRPWWKFWGR
jgi:hypothetical protein